MEYTSLDIKDVVLMTPKVFEDDRGFFMEIFRADGFSTRVAQYPFVQDNHSSSVKGTLRGLHYQIRHTQGKLVRVTQGEVFDVAVDLRRSSPDFGRWVGVALSAENKQMLWIPPGFAHGFYVLSEQAEFTYKCTDYYAPEHERVILWNDPDISIDWPVIPGVELLLSQKDQAGVDLKAAEVFA
ncbi:MAG TPA: dTDP-4-dehydrorhamnose 3,5-epimerase [Desulfobacteraceae bacterium]|nr:dTDP-4-dehydrorhamnose 3,5-epimerase [Desulfobacteraceae bacterium]|tara:strand:- start:836 stop:1384 length:549 start_codon:yes stop_codon:yes gene_type:complete